MIRIIVIMKCSRQICRCYRVKHFIFPLFGLHSKTKYKCNATAYFCLQWRSLYSHQYFFFFRSFELRKVRTEGTERKKNRKKSNWRITFIERNSKWKNNKTMWIGWVHGWNIKRRKRRRKKLEEIWVRSVRQSNGNRKLCNSCVKWERFIELVADCIWNVCLSKQYNKYESYEWKDNNGVERESNKTKYTKKATELSCSDVTFCRV